MLRRHCVEPTPNQEPSHARDVRRFGRRVGDEYVRARDHAPPDAGRGSLIDYRHSGNRGDLRSRRWLGEWSWS